MQRWLLRTVGTCQAYSWNGQEKRVYSASAYSPGVHPVHVFPSSLPEKQKQKKKKIHCVHKLPNLSLW